jgi:uncharacterized protein YuzE
MKITYSPTANAAYIYLVDTIAPGGVARSYACDPLAVNGMINLDFDSDGALIRVEVLDARRKLPAALLASAELRP